MQIIIFLVSLIKDLHIGAIKTSETFKMLSPKLSTPRLDQSGFAKDQSNYNFYFLIPLEKTACMAILPYLSLSISLFSCVH